MLNEHKKQSSADNRSTSDIQKIQETSMNQCCNLSDIKVTYSIKDILLQRKNSFLLELKNDMKLSFSTTVYVKTPKTIKYEKGKLIIMNHKLFVLDVPQVIHKKGTNEPIISKVIEGYYHPLLSLDFEFVTPKLILHKHKYKMKIMILGYKKAFNIKITSKEIFNKIVQLLYHSISKSRGSKENLLGICFFKDFYVNEYIKATNFSLEAATCDLLIFKGFELPARCQRMFTQAQYDHVALLVRKDNGLHVYESTAKDGAKLRPWIQFLYQYWNLLYEKMVYRKLIINSHNREKVEEDIYAKAFQFINETQGKEYRLKGCGFCFVESMKDFEKNNQWSQSEGFFCSQLVAAAYYKCGIMPYVADSRHFLPGAFAQRENIELNTGFSLGQEMVIDFSN